MPTASPLSDVSIQETIERAMLDVCRTMLSLKPEIQPDTGENLYGVPLASRFVIPGPRLVGTVGFLGDLNGLISLFFSPKFAQSAASRMLGMSAEELVEAGDEVVNDVIGEITNMTAGTFKNQLADRGYPCKLTIPSILGGTDISLEHVRGTARRVYRFKVDDQIVFVDVQLKETAE